MEQGGLCEKQPVKRRERSSKWKSSARKRVEQGKKGALLAIKLPHTGVPQWMPHSQTIKPSNRHWGDITLHPQGKVWWLWTNAQPQSSHWRKWNQSSPVWLKNTKAQNIHVCLTFDQHQHNKITFNSEKNPDGVWLIHGPQDWVFILFHSVVMCIQF